MSLIGSGILNLGIEKFTLLFSLPPAVRFSLLMGCFLEHVWAPHSPTHTHTHIHKPVNLDFTKEKCDSLGHAGFLFTQELSTVKPFEFFAVPARQTVLCVNYLI